MGTGKIKIRWTIDFLSATDFEGNIDAIISRLNKIKTDAPDRFQDVTIEYDGDGSYDVIGHAEESEEEYQKRLETERKEKEETEQRLEQQDYRLYQNLKKRFEPA